MSENAVEVSHLTKQFTLREESRDTFKERFVKGSGGKKTTFDAVKDVSFEIKKGSSFGLVGHNGSGKSTLLKMMAGVYRPTKGKVRVRGSTAALLELGAGFHPDLTGRENIALNGAILGLSKKQIAASVDKIVDFAELGPFIDVPVKQYSSGMYVRLGFAIAVMLDPDILIVDEVIAVGDEAFQRKCFDHIYKLRSKGTTIALVTHSMAIAREMCEEAIWMDHGVAKLHGPIDDVVEHYLAEVNRQEEDLYVAELEQAQDVPRRGSGEAIVEEATFVNSGGEPTTILRSGEDYSLRLDIASTVDIGEVDVMVEVYLESGALLASMSSAFEGKKYDIPRGQTRVELFLPGLPLQPGSYWISTSLRSVGHVWDHIDRGLRVLVRSEESSPMGGPLRLLGRWDQEQLL